jgi:ribose/xylose/arabinose/galactoside ABC-type transport system permease subunit
MDLTGIVRDFGHEMVEKISQDIYQQIVWEYVIYSIKVGIIAGLIMAAVGMILGFARFSSLDLTTYTGCMLTGQNKGKTPFIVGFVFHILMSAVFGVVYLYLIHYFKIPGTILYAVALGVAHSLFSGSCMLILDVINPCVRDKKVPAAGFMATAQGMRAMITYVIIHVVYAFIVLSLLTR